MRRFVYKHQKTGDYKMDYIYRYHSPIGSMTMASNGTSLTGLSFDGQKMSAQAVGGAVGHMPIQNVFDI